jgi:hypothetical protein
LELQDRDKARLVLVLLGHLGVGLSGG